ncbi:glycosyltransferase family 2 protein [Streptococcus suis]|uniref:Glycosyltransferase n=1 Tax=Streptococcus suis TaxID=1307 RepID=A0A3R8T7Z8_STRSU|nr:glycosyltransferase [Streptococcus suis]MBY4962866.1 glycosyltransferase family 2 protein [Streptococcus suis]MBY4968918.1 glycosyltransferase family 2 protein [Streptococcus suis]MBY4980287.1 glycosyltransferase family 2 protein [Streptococcus suis]MBY4988859.1 glycosyltransferase family 2 protein [Streptococcus suis]MBY4995082.1 glycosyltransferase family 2 protein [Streptococcus suis]
MSEKIAVLLPAYNEEVTIVKVIEDFKKALPDADIYVYDNNSKDRTNELAREAGAIVRFEPRQGKGNVVRSMFREIDADFYIMADADDTYPATEVEALLQPLRDGLADMTIGDRLSNGTYAEENKRGFHGFGNNLVRMLVNKLYRGNYNDIMTGYRGFNRLFVKTFPVLSPGFEIETELSIHSLDKRFKLVEVPITYKDRPEGSESKLSTFSDGFKVLRMIFNLFKDYKPLIFFTILTIVCFILGLIVGLPVIGEFAKTGMINKLPSAVLATGFMILSALSFVAGFILDTVVRQQRMQYELKVYDYYHTISK